MPIDTSLPDDSSSPRRVCTVTFLPSEKTCQCSCDVSLLQAAQQAGLPLASACGGVGQCGQCRVVMLHGHVSEPGDNEKEVLSPGEQKEGFRLACQTFIHGDVTVRVPESSLVKKQKLQTESNLTIEKGESPVCTIPVHLEKPTVEDSRPDLFRLAEHLPLADKEILGAGLPVLRQFPVLARNYNWDFNTILRGTEVIGILPAGKMPVGLAVDLGTTKIAAGLFDIPSGTQLAVGGVVNPQISYGEDIISRMAYVLQHKDGGTILSRVVREELDSLLGELTAQAGISRDQVAEICVVGNTAMIHLFLELPVRALATSPFTAVTLSPMEVKASDAGFTAAPGAYVHILPGIGGFVGADHVAMILSSGLDHSPHISLGIDIGTNTEIFLTWKEKGIFRSVSCASGPAFEGVHIRCGMRAGPGAVEAVTLTPRGPRLKIIDDVPPEGICGSGLIDVVAEFLRLGIVDHRGRFDREHTLVRKGEKGYEFVLVPRGEGSHEKEIVITQDDINQIQLAKGAIRAGLDILLESASLNASAVHDVYIAGAFGTYLNIENAVRIGLIPGFSAASVKQIGNAALAGAAQGLLSKQFRNRARVTADKTHHFELTTYPEFNLRFAYGMLFPLDNQ